MCVTEIIVKLETYINRLAISNTYKDGWPIYNKPKRSPENGNKINKK